MLELDADCVFDQPFVNPCTPRNSWPLTSTMSRAQLYLVLSMMWQMMSGARRKRLLLLMALSVCISIWCMGITSPSGVVVFLTTCRGRSQTLSGTHHGRFKCAGGVLACNLMVAPMIMLFLRSPMRTMKHSRLFLTAITAWRLKISVSARRLDWAVFMKIQPDNQESQQFG